MLFARRAVGERDYVHEEIATALKRGITVIPLLIERTPLPRPDALPDDIRNLVLYHKHNVVHERFGRDIAGLIEAITAVRRKKSAGGMAPGALGPCRRHRCGRAGNRRCRRVLRGLTGGAAGLRLCCVVYPGSRFQRRSRGARDRPAT